MRRIYIDERWYNLGGIGTFANSINAINNYDELRLNGSPVSPIDCIRLSWRLLKIKDGVVFLPGYIPPLFSTVPYVFTIHDLNHLDRKENSTLFKRFFYNLIIKNGCKKAKYIFTVSEFSKERIVEWAKISPDKVINVGNGVSEEFTSRGEKMFFDFPYILCVSNRKGHKNELGTLKAFSKSSIDSSVKLVFTGEPDSVILRNIRELSLENRVLFTGRVKSQDLPKLYRSASALIFVSFYEGFGLPVIEAQASGVPVITSGSTALREIAGDGAVIVNPFDIDEISDGINRVLNGSDIFINELIQKGHKNCERYSWRKTAIIIEKHLRNLCK
ncbi:glycosyltransferase family 4 protein [Klebsiella pneumoniae]|nr:glycosyltransferase family 4 protein [Klebsiella pneumoniae]HBW8258054.1 glycosyltransferase family 4 protein [Klebsiella pneumoniae]HBW8263664.1 glycosyltransferase family 4 protein [Klebsiella pneumoniae]